MNESDSELLQFLNIHEILISNIDEFKHQIVSVLTKIYFGWKDSSQFNKSKLVWKTLQKKVGCM